LRQKVREQVTAYEQTMRKIWRKELNRRNE
jgi:hypothetical protein